jgi:DNA-binding LytR/AlgR family response regulator
MQLRCIIVDDEPMARKGIAEELKEIAFVELVGSAENAYQAMDLVALLRPDLILLDISMPGLSGLDFIKTLRQPPMVIITTAFSEYAVEGFELDVVDFLVKPFDFNRLLKACCKAKEFWAFRLAGAGSAPAASGVRAGLAGAADAYFFVKVGGKYEKILFRELLFVEAADNYVFLHTIGKKWMVYDTLKNMEALLPAGDFMKVHKSFIVALNKVSTVEGNMLVVERTRIPVSRGLKEEVLRRVVG